MEGICSAARSGYCNATVAKATKRSGWTAQNSACFSCWIAMIWRAKSRSAVFQGCVEILDDVGHRAAWHLEPVEEEHIHVDICISTLPCRCRSYYSP